MSSSQNFRQVWLLDMEEPDAIHNAVFRYGMGRQMNVLDDEDTLIGIASDVRAMQIPSLKPAETAILRLVCDVEFLENVPDYDPDNGSCWWLGTIKLVKCVDYSVQDD